MFVFVGMDLFCYEIPMFILDVQLLFSTMQTYPKFFRISFGFVHLSVHFVLQCRTGSALYANLSQDCLVYIRMEGTSRRKLRSRSRSFWYLAFLFTLTCSQAVLAECKCTHVCDYQRAVERCAEKFVHFLFLSI